MLATFSACDTINISPEDAVLAPNLCTGVAFDNYDGRTGKDSLYDTVGIFFIKIFKQMITVHLVRVMIIQYHPHRKNEEISMQ